MMLNDINRIKVVLAEKKITNKKLSELINKTPTTISRWCNNETQPSLETLVHIANKIGVDVRELLNQTK